VIRGWIYYFDILCRLAILILEKAMKLKKILILLIASIIINRGEGFLLSWSKSIEPDVQGYVVYKTRVPGDKGNEFKTILNTSCINNKCSTERLYVNEPGTHYFKVFAYDANSISQVSNEVRLIIDDATPSGIFDLSIQRVQ
jgi:hypothetical protein